MATSSAGSMPAGTPGLSPWTVTEKDGRYYGRGVVDNKGQHTINIAAQAAVLAERGKLGFNAKWLIEMGEETGSPGLRELCAEHRDLLAADVLVGSDGPRLTADRPTISLGTRGAYPIDIWIDAREGGHHSGNWGGLLSSPAIQLVHALSTITGPDRADPHPRMGAGRHSGLGAARARRLRGEVRPGRSRDRSELGRARTDAGREGVRLVHVRDPRDDVGRAGKPGQRRPAARLGARADPLRGRHRSGSVPPRAAPPSRSPRLPDGADRQGPRRHHDGDAARSRASVGALGRDFARQDHEQEAGGAAECRRLAAERHLLRRPRPADDLGAALLSGLLAACAERALPGGARARGARHHGGALLGPRRARHAAARQRDGADFLRLARLPEGAGR